MDKGKLKSFLDITNFIVICSLQTLHPYISDQLSSKPKI